MKNAIASLLFALAAAAACAANILPIPEGLDGDGVEISADSFEVDRKTGWVVVRKNVRVKTGNHSLSADKARLNRETGDVQASGNVVIRQTGFGTWTGDYVEYNYKTGKGMTGTGRLEAGPFSVWADELTRREDGDYDLRGLCVTTCTNAPGDWHWCMRGSGRFRDNDYVSIRNVVPYLFGVPFAWLPYWYRDLDTSYGFRLMPGYTSKWGPYLLGGYVFPIYDAPNGDGPSLYGSFHADYRAKRGAAAGQNVHWDLKRWGQGRFESYYANDIDPPNSREDRNWMSRVSDDRYRFRLFHNADLTERDQFILRGAVVSDSEMRSDFFERENRGESIPMNFASLEHRETSWAAGSEVSGPLNNFYSGVSRYPEGWLNIEPQPLAIGANYESQTRAGWLDRDPARYEWASDDYKYYPGDWADYSTFRADTAHRLTRPFKLDDWLSIVPRAGYRMTYYANSGDGDDFARHSGDFGAEISTRGVSEWENNRRHVFEPYIDYSWQPTTTTGGGGRPYLFDRFDGSYGWLDQFGLDDVWLPYDWHGIRPGLRNIIETRDAKGRVRSLLDTDLYAACQFDSSGPKDENGLRLLGAKARYAPTDDLDLHGQAEWDAQEDTMAYTDFSAFYQVSKGLRVGGGYIARDHELYGYDVSPVMAWNRMKENLAYGGFTHVINDTWSYSPFVRYDMRENELDEIGATVQYSLDCLVFQMRISYLNDFERIDGTTRDSDFRIAFMVWLKAQGKEPDEEWQRW